MRKLLLSLIAFFTLTANGLAEETVDLRIDATAQLFGFDNSQAGYWTLLVQTEDVYMYMSPQTAYEVAGTYHTADWYDLNGFYGTFMVYKSKRYAITEFELTVEQFPESDVDYTFKGYMLTKEGTRFNLDLTTGYHEETLGVSDVKMGEVPRKYISDGKLVIVKDGKRYDVTGRETN